jgi:SAM-dependent methyltransferase
MRDGATSSGRARVTRRAFMARSDDTEAHGLDRAARLWGERSARLGDQDVAKGNFWSDKAAVRRHHNRKISGDEQVDWIAHVANHYLPTPPLDRCLSLGCGSGKLERWLLARGVVRSFDAYDLSPQSIEMARRLAAEAGHAVRYEVADINRLTLPASTYDAVWIYHAMHHFRDLEAICERIARCLKPEGLLILNDYVGPSRFQLPRRQVEVIDACLRLLPERFRRIVPPPHESAGAPALLRHWLTRARDKASRGELIGAVWRRLRRARNAAGDRSIRRRFTPPTAQQVIDVDPTEAIRSDEILPVIGAHFDIVRRWDYGGTVLQFLMQDILANFPDGDADGEAYLDMMIDIEDTLISRGDLPSAFAVVVARPARPTRTSVRS